MIVPAGLEVDANFSVSFFDEEVGGMTTKYPVSTITNYQYEEKLQTERRNIFLLEPRYLNVVKDDLEEMMEYEKGSTQYVSRTLKRGENIRLFQ